MQAIVGQLGELFLQAVPTVLIILLFYIILRALFFKPLLQVMAERDSRTAGAQKAAEAAQVAAAEKVKQYQDALKQARRKRRANSCSRSVRHNSKRRGRRLPRKSALEKNGLLAN